MKLLIITQTVDTENPVLGFFHEWISMLARRVERVEVVCLTLGAHALRDNVRIYSLEKERGRRSSLSYAYTFLKHVWRVRNDYDTVFVHMNEEYVLLAGMLWRLLGKKIFLWRNHYEGSWKTVLAGLLSHRVFYTSTHSYTATFANAERMPVGVDLVRFMGEGSHPSHTVLFFSRFSPSKRPEMLIDALAILQERGVSFSASIVGSPLAKDEPYHRMLQEKARRFGLSQSVHFSPGVPSSQASEIFRAHAIFVNTSPSGMFDKTLFEAAASGCVVLACSDDWRLLLSDEHYFTDVASLSERLSQWLSASVEAYLQAQKKEQMIAHEHSLEKLTQLLVEKFDA